ncbi:hypothetical protein PZB74_21530 [Porifericola rhodea]|uniref:hypothetical protein n=1 Tax=Porifericola rhodea TaxID=930972 RepID=UPI002667179E|nr:hypothetical protein [Porifericola rhodea]WKN31532.1 hypothetical protein PZB74_21530 [Porifericola rhodea]
MENSIEKETINGLLNLITNQHSDISWKKRCLYSNGENNHVLEIRLYQYPDDYPIGRIVYNANNGNVIQMKYRGRYNRNSTNIVDVLLDTINMENQSHTIA